jgi:hypothetical protein
MCLAEQHSFCFSRGCATSQTDTTKNCTLKVRDEKKKILSVRVENDQLFSKPGID